jgi:hypothetical protein
MSVYDAETFEVMYLDFVQSFGNGFSVHFQVKTI